MHTSQSRRTHVRHNTKKPQTRASIPNQHQDYIQMSSTSTCVKSETCFTLIWCTTIVTISWFIEGAQARKIPSTTKYSTTLRYQTTNEKRLLTVSITGWTFWNGMVWSELHSIVWLGFFAMGFDTKGVLTPPYPPKTSYRLPSLRFNSIQPKIRTKTNKGLFISFYYLKIS